MTEILAFFNEWKGVVGGPVAIGIAVFGYLWTQRNAREMAGADSAGQIKALSVYEGMLEDERKARQMAEQRADEFAKERNDAMKEFYELKGQMKEMAQQIERQNQMIEGLRQQVRHLEEQLKNVNA